MQKLTLGLLPRKRSAVRRWAQCLAPLRAEGKARPLDWVLVRLPAGRPQC